MEDVLKEFPFKLGDKVFSPSYGKGQVVAIGDFFENYSIEVNFNKTLNLYTNEGYERRELPYRTLFHEWEQASVSTRIPVAKDGVGLPLFEGQNAYLFIEEDDKIERIVVLASFLHSKTGHSYPTFVHKSDCEKWVSENIKPSLQEAYEKFTEYVNKRRGLGDQEALYGLIAELGKIYDLIRKVKFQGQDMDRKSLKIACREALFYWVWYKGTPSFATFLIFSNAEIIDIEEAKPKQLNEFLTFDIFAVIKENGLDIAEIMERNVERGGATH